MRAYHERIGPIMRWFGSALRRLKRLGAFGDEAETCRLTVAVYNALHALKVHTHYASIDGAGQLNEWPEQ